MSSFSARSIITIPDGMQGRFQELIDEALVVVRQDYEGVVQYGWYLSDDGATCVVLETFADSDAAIRHIHHTAPYLSRLLDFASYKLEVYGEISDELQAMVAGMNPTFYSSWRSVP